MKKALFILPRFSFGGTVFSTLNMISFLSKGDINIYVLGMTHQGPVKQLYGGIQLLPENFFLSALSGSVKNESNIFKKTAFIIVKAVDRLLNIFGVNLRLIVYKHVSRFIQNKYKFDIVSSCQEGDSTYFASYFTSEVKLAWCRTEYSLYKNQISKQLVDYEQKCYPLFNKIICVSQTTTNDFIKYFPDIKDKVIAIHNIQNVENIRKSSLDPIEDERYIDDEFIILSVGRISPQKQFPAIPKIAYELKKDNVSFKWYIIGEGNDAGENDKLQQNIKDYHVEDHVICLGSKLNPYPYIKKANLLVNTSLYEACPRVVIEAKILKTPVICADFSSAKEFVTNDYDGYVDTIDNLYLRIKRMIQDTGYYNTIKDNCNKHEIDNDAIFEKLSQLFA